ncbi:MAG: hypothetical protein WC450_07145 [Candidatus Omnitrophota bacterium]|jgi:hypothetical protein
MNPDITICLTALISFAAFLVIHFIVFRFVSEGGVLKWIMALFAMGSLGNAGLFIVFSGDAFLQSWAYRTVLLLMSWSIYALLSFLYVLCIFGPYESSIRLRLIRELYRRHPQGLTLGQLYERYNNAVIVRRRIARLLAARSITVCGEKYQVANRLNFFSFADTLARLISKCTQKL